MTQVKESGIGLKITTFIAIVVAVSSVVAAHFKGVAEAIASSNRYTDQQIEKVVDTLNGRLDRIWSRLDKMEERQEKIFEIVSGIRNARNQ